MRTTHPSWWVVSLILAFAAPAPAQSRFDSWNTENGLPQNSITFMDVIARFDGERAVTFVPADFPHGLGIAQSPSGVDVWWSHDPSGLHLLIDGQVKTYPIDDRLLAGAVVNIDRSGTVWVRDRLDAALRRFDRGRIRGGCDKLSALVEKVEAFVRRGELSADAGQLLIGAATALRTQNGCR